MFREALKAGLYELHDARDRYRLACGLEGMRKDLMLRYVEVCNAFLAHLQPFFAFCIVANILVPKSSGLALSWCWYAFHTSARPHTPACSQSEFRRPLRCRESHLLMPCCRCPRCSSCRWRRTGQKRSGQPSSAGPAASSRRAGRLPRSPTWCSRCRPRSRRHSRALLRHEMGRGSPRPTRQAVLLRGIAAMTLRSMRPCGATL